MEAPVPGATEPVESADVQAIGLKELHRAALSSALGVLLGVVLAQLGRRAEPRHSA